MDIEARLAKLERSLGAWKAITAGLVLVFVLAGSAQAQIGLDVYYGFTWAKAIFLGQGTVTADHMPMDSGTTWTGELEIQGGDRDSAMTVFGIGLSRFEAESSIFFMDLAGHPQVDMYAVTWLWMGWVSRFMTPIGQDTRFYVQGGLGMCNINVEATRWIGAERYSSSLSDKSNKGAFGGGIGLHHKISKNVYLLGRVQYVHVFVDDDFNPSQFTGRVGVGFGG